MYYRVAKTKVLISFAVTAKLICAFVFAYADCWFSHEAAHILQVSLLVSLQISGGLLQIRGFKDQSDQRTGSNGCRTDAERTENMQKILVR